MKFGCGGGCLRGGRSPGIWDIFAHSGRMPDNSNGDVAADQYRKYREDLKLMADMGFEAYRFSISWSRILADGREKVNQEGIKYYPGHDKFLMAFLYPNYPDPILLQPIQALASLKDISSIPMPSGVEPNVTLHLLDHPLKSSKMSMMDVLALKWCTFLFSNISPAKNFIFIFWTSS